MSTLLFIYRGWNLSMSSGGKLNTSEEMLSSIRKFKQLIADAYMPIQGTRGAKHGVQPWQKHQFLAKEFMRKISKNGTYSSFLDRFQKVEVFHASQLLYNWTKEWCEYLDYNRSIDIAHKVFPEQLERYATLYHFRYHPQQMEKDPMKSCPDWHETKRAIVSRNKETGQNTGSMRRNNYREDLDPEKLDWLIWLSHNWTWYFAVNRISDLNYTQSHHQESEEEHASGNREALTRTSDNWWKAHWWNMSWWEKSRWTWSDVIWSFFFLKKNQVSHPRRGNYCVCDREVYTRSVSHTFFWHSFFAWRTDIAYTHGSRLKEFAVRMSYLSVSHLPFSCLISRPCCSRTVTSTPRSRLHRPRRTVPDLKALVKRTSAWAARSLDTWPDSTHSTGYGPKELDKVTSVDGDTTPINDPNRDNISEFSKTTRESIGLFGVLAVFDASVSQVSPGGFALHKTKKHMHREPLHDRERDERESSVISDGESMSRKSRRNSMRSHSLQTHRKSFSDERDLREHLERRAQQAVLGENAAQRKLHLTEYDMEIQNLEGRNSEYALTESQRELESQRRPLLEANQWSRSSSTWENTLV